MTLAQFVDSLQSNTPREKNLSALLILITGLFLGSLFVDMGQLLTRSGFSGSALREQTVLEAAGKTWVAYTEPAIDVQVLTDDTCAACSPDEALVWMRRVIPTLRAEKIDAASFAGKELIMKHQIATLPAFVFSQGIETTDFFTQAAPLFRENDQHYFFDMNEIGLPVGKYLAAPEALPQDIRLGQAEAALTVTLFTDFACEFCQDLHTTLKSLVAEYGDRVAFVVKHFPLPNHAHAELAAESASCANEQGLFLPYSELLFREQKTWTKQSDANAPWFFKNSAWKIKGLDGRAFAQCLDNHRFQELVANDTQQGRSFHLQVAPAIFVGTEFVSGAAPETTLRDLIDTHLKAE